MEVLTNTLKPNPTQLYLIARALDGDIKNFFKDPLNEAAFEEWKSKKEELKNEIHTKRIGADEGQVW